MKGYVKVLQWYGNAKHIDELQDASQHTGDAAQVDKLLGWNGVKVEPTQPYCITGEVVFRVEDNGALTLVAASYDSSG